jgi:monoamine oxidase
MTNNPSNFNPFRYTQQFDQPFSFQQLYRYPDQLKQQGDKASRKKIAVIGGGIAGLTSAYELSQRGYQVRLLEASSRLGGRIYTHYFSDGTYGELGATRIPYSHGCVQYYVDQFNLPTRPFISHNPAGFYHLRGHKVRIEAVADLFSTFNLTSQEQQDPGILYDDLLQELVATLSETEKWQMFSPTFDSPLLQKYDSISFTQYFRDRLSPEAFEFMGHATGMIHYEKVSLLEGIIDFFSWYRVEQYQLVGGMATLINAFAQRLPHQIQCNAKVTAIHITDNGVKVYWHQQGQSQVQQFDGIICTIPASALTQIEFNPSLPEAKQQALAGLTYGSAVKTLFHCTARPWELYDNIYGGGSFTDLPIEKCWYPADNTVEDPELSHHPTVLTAAYRWEDNARQFLTLDQQEQTDSTLHQVKQLHPQIEQYVDEIVHYAWDEQAQLGSGAYAYFTPGDHEKFQAVLCQPYPVDQPRVFFAGEHLAINHASIQGAIQTALFATIDVLKQFNCDF